MTNPNTQPIYTKTIETGIVLLKDEVAGRNPGTVNLPILFQAGEAGALIQSIQAWRRGDEPISRELRIYRKRATDDKPFFCAIKVIGLINTLGDPLTGESGEAAASYVEEVALPSILLGTNKTGLYLEANETLYCALSGALTSGVNVIATGGQYS